MWEIDDVAALQRVSEKAGCTREADHLDQS
ncbi:hypothetical protein SDC9_80036 [bioreactor metagenome]|uniref:Uncharacterized protein n=1 Tax=bioreactor metagenome TaxID=1076179 RepID=A0A644Z0D3_9ZZZZ